eukprot:2698764-Ditylum_brightwellii.AAC.1
MKGVTAKTVKGLRSVQIQTASMMTDKMSWSQLTESSREITTTNNKQTEQEATIVDSIDPSSSDSSTECENDFDYLSNKLRKIRAVVNVTQGKKFQYPHKCRPANINY